MSEKPTPQKIMDWIRQEIELRKRDAGMSGSYADNGASQLEAQLDVYACAFEGLIPTTWRGIVEQRIMEADPEYQEYLRLQEKFKGRMPKC